jgi:hypothetical protein
MNIAYLQSESGQRNFDAHRTDDFYQQSLFSVEGAGETYHRTDLKVNRRKQQPCICIVTTHSAVLATKYDCVAQFFTA